MEMTPEQKVKLRALQKSAIKTAGILGIKISAMVLFSNLIVVGLAFFVLHSPSFSFVGGFVNGIFIFSYLNINLQKERDRIKLETKKILES